MKGWDSVHHIKVCTALKSAKHQMTTGCATLLSTPIARTGNEFFEWDLDEGEGHEREEHVEEGCDTSIAHHQEYDDDSANNKNVIALEVSAYLASLDTLEPAHFCEGLRWGPTYQSRTSELTRVVTKFLRVTMLGDGLSRAHMQALLEFTHEMGGKKAALLPKKIDGCWRALTKVFAS